MPKLFIVPIEPIPLRYSCDWFKWFKNAGDCLAGFDQIEFIIPNSTPSKIENGEFLDVIYTNIYKNAQLTELLHLIKLKAIQDNDIIFFMDYWFPGVESLFYIRDALGINFKITGMLHAGTWDKHDYLYHCGMREWGKYVEAAWLFKADKLYVATEFHKELIIENHMDSEHVFGHEYELLKKIKVTGFPIQQPNARIFDPRLRDKSIVFPHRLAPEKQPECFDTLKHVCIKHTHFHPYTFIKTMETIDSSESKTEYYECLGRARFAISFALQETWGIAMQESVLCGAYPIVPDTLAYSELYPKEFKYTPQDSDVDTAYTIKNMIINIDNHPSKYQPILKALQHSILLKGSNAIPNIMGDLLCL